VSVVLDRPFLFFIRERRGPVLFAGQIVSLPG
jgi:serine protease inhibitor